jgi:rhomboid protease GluP
MNLELFSRLIGGAVILAAACACAVHLQRVADLRAKRATPLAAIAIIGCTALITALQFVFPVILADFRRNQGALMAGQWWRMVTPLFVQASGWKQCCANGIGAVVFCPLAERLYGKWLWVLYFVSGIFGEIFGYAWNPTGAGSSLAIAGVIGGLFAFAFAHQREIPRAARNFAATGLGGAFLLCIDRDVHGPPLIMGALLGSVIEHFRIDTSQPIEAKP